MIEPIAPADCADLPFFLLFGHHDLGRSLCEILVGRAFDQKRLGLDGLFLCKLFLRLQIFFVDPCRKIQRLDAERHRLDQRRTAAKHGPREPFVLVAPFRKAFGRRDDLAVRFAAGDRVGRRRTHHYALHHGLAADDQVALHREYRVQESKFSCDRFAFIAFQLTASFVAFVALLLCSGFRFNTLKSPVAFQITFFNFADLLDALLPQLASKFVLGDHLLFKFLSNNRAVLDQNNSGCGSKPASKTAT